MRKRHRTVLAVIVVAVMIGAVTWRILRAREPVFEGKELSVWLEGYQISRHKVGSLQRNKADEAMRDAGTNAMPTLLRMLRAHDSPLKLKLLNLAQRQKLIRVNYVPASAKKYTAGVAFGTLGSAASNAVPELIRIYQQDSSLQTRNAIIIALGHIGPPARDAIPLLLEAAGSTNIPLRANSANTLKAIDGEAAAKPGVR